MSWLGQSVRGGHSASVPWFGQSVRGRNGPSMAGLGVRRRLCYSASMARLRLDNSRSNRCGLAGAYAPTNLGCGGIAGRLSGKAIHHTAETEHTNEGKLERSMHLDGGTKVIKLVQSESKRTNECLIEVVGRLDYVGQKKS